MSTLSTRRKNGITVREVARRKYQVDFEERRAGSRRRFRRYSPYDTLGKTFAWAERMREEVIHEMLHGKAAPERRARPDEPRTFAWWAKRYVEDSSNPTRKHGANRPHTVKRKQEMLQRHLLPAFENKLVTTIGEVEITAFCGEKAEHYAPGYVGQMAGLLKAILAFAFLRGNAAERQHRVPQVVVNIRRDEVDEDIPPTLTEEQVAHFLVAAEESGDLDALWWLAVMFRQGLRPGEALALRHGDIDLEARTLRVARTRLRNGTYGPPKGKRTRTLPLHHEVAGLYLSRAEASLRAPHELVMRSSQSGARRAGKGPSASAMLHRTEMVFYDLGFRAMDGAPAHWMPKMGRHSFGRHWAERGLPLAGLQQLLGHRKIETTMVYAHWTPSASADLIDQIGSPKLGLVELARSASSVEIAALRRFLEEHHP